MVLPYSDGCYTMNSLQLFVTLTLISALSLLCASQELNQSMELLESLLKNYDRRFRPVLNQSLPLVIDVKFDLLKIADFDEVTGKFAVTGILHIFWTDEKFKWNPMDYGGVKSLRVPLNDVWYPVLILVYPYEKYEDFGDEWMTVTLSSNGFATYFPGAIFKSACNVDVSYYPFDVQTCSLIFSPWAFARGEIIVNAPSQYVERTHFIEHGEWEIIGNSSLTSATVRNTVEFTFKLQRKPLFLVTNIILPIVLLSFLNILIFALPPQSGERISYGITVLLAFAVFMTIVGDTLPKTSQPMAVLSFFLVIDLTMSGLMCIAAIINLRVYFKEDGEQFTCWALFIIRVARCTCRRPNQNLTDLSSDKYQNDVNDIQTRYLPNASGMGSARESKNFTWMDVSKAIDKMCFVFFFLGTVINTATFVIVVTLGPE